MYSFFGLTPTYKQELHKTIISIIYRCTAFGFHDLYNMPIWMRKFYLRELAAMKRKEAGKAGSEERQSNVASNVNKIKALQQKFSSGKQ